MLTTLLLALASAASAYPGMGSPDFHASLNALAARDTSSSTSNGLIGDLCDLPASQRSQTGSTVAQILTGQQPGQVPSASAYYPAPLNTQACAQDTCCVWHYIAQTMEAAFRGPSGRCNDLARQAIRLGFREYFILPNLSKTLPHHRPFLMRTMSQQHQAVLTNSPSLSRRRSRLVPSNRPARRRRRLDRALIRRVLAPRQPRPADHHLANATMAKRLPERRHGGPDPVRRHHRDGRVPAGAARPLLPGPRRQRHPRAGRLAAAAVRERGEAHGAVLEYDDPAGWVGGVDRGAYDEPAAVCGSAEGGRSAG